MKKFFTKGLIALLPMALTIILIYLFLSTLYAYVGVPVGKGLEYLLSEFGGKTLQEFAASPEFQQWAPYIGCIVGVILTFVIGFLVATFLGKKLYQLFERILARLPIIRVIYPYARQFTDFFFSSEQKMEFKNAVAVPFPTQGIYSIGFVTAEGMKAIDESTQKHLLCVYVPTSPTPFTGYVIYVPREDVIPLPITVEEAMRLIISMGVVHPPHQAVVRGTPPPQSVPHAPVPEDLERKLTKDQEEKNA